MRHLKNLLVGALIVAVLGAAFSAMVTFTNTGFAKYFQDKLWLCVAYSEFNLWAAFWKHFTGFLVSGGAVVLINYTFAMIVINRWQTKQAYVVVWAFAVFISIACAFYLELKLTWLPAEGARPLLKYFWLCAGNSGQILDVRSGHGFLVSFLLANLAASCGVLLYGHWQTWRWKGKQKSVEKV